MAVGLLSTKEAAEYLSLTPKTLKNWRVTGRGPRYVKMGRRVAYRLIDIDRWVQEKTRTNTGE